MKILFGADLHVSPRGEAKCVRRPSGLGASRAEEKGASRLARAGVLAKSPPSPCGLRNTALPVHWPSDNSSGANQAPAHGFHESRDTKHESRPLYRVLRPSGGEKCRLVSPCRPDGRSRCPVTAFLRAAGRPWRGMGGILPPLRRPCPVRRSRSASRRAPFAGNPGKVYKIPLPPGKRANRSAPQLLSQPGPLPLW